MYGMSHEMKYDAGGTIKKGLFLCKECLEHVWQKLYHGFLMQYNVNSVYFEITGIYNEVLLNMLYMLCALQVSDISIQ